MGRQNREVCGKRENDNITQSTATMTLEAPMTAAVLQTLNFMRSPYDKCKFWHAVT
jgi:hypothetical protein